MKCNMSKTDRIIRLIVGLVIIGIGLYFKSWWGVIGILPIVFAAVGYCPAYPVFGINNCECKNDCCEEKKSSKKK